MRFYLRQIALLAGFGAGFGFGGDGLDVVTLGEDAFGEFTFGAAIFAGAVFGSVIFGSVTFGSASTGLLPAAAATIAARIRPDSLQ